MNTQGSRPCEGRGRDWAMHLQSQRGQGWPATPEAMRDAQGGFSLTTPRGNQPCQHLNFRLLASRMCERINICHLSAPRKARFVQYLVEIKHPRNADAYKEPSVGWCCLHSCANEVGGTASASHGGTIFTDGARSSPGMLLGLQRPPWLCPKQRGIPEGTCEAWAQPEQLSHKPWGTWPTFLVTRSIRAGWGEKPQTFFLFCFYWDCTEVCGELYLFAERGILHFQEPAFPILFGSFHLQKCLPNLYHLCF